MRIRENSVGSTTETAETPRKSTRAYEIRSIPSIDRCTRRMHGSIHARKALASFCESSAFYQRKFPIVLQLPKALPVRQRQWWKRQHAAFSHFVRGPLCIFYAHCRDTSWLYINLHILIKRYIIFHGDCQQPFHILLINHKLSIPCFG